MIRYLLVLGFFFSFEQASFSQNALDNAGLTAATPSAVAFSLRKLSSAYPGYAIKVRRSSDNVEANVAFDGSNTVSSTSLITFTPNATVGSTFGTTQTGTISSDVSKIGTIIIKATKTGTITTSNASLTITGTGTNFTTEVVAGDRLFNASNNVFLGVVASVTNNTTLLLNNYSTVPLSAIGFKTTLATVSGTGTNFTAELTPGDRLFTTANSYLGTVVSVTNATTLALNAIDAVSTSSINYKGTTAIITGTSTNFLSLTVGDLLISNNVTLGIIASITNAASLTLTAKSGGSVSGLAFKATTGTIPFSTFYSGMSVYVNTWYDQSGNGRDAIQLKPTNQARIVNAGTLYTVNGKTSIEFSSALASYLQTATVASYLNSTLYTLNKVTAEATINPALQLPISTTGGNGPNNTISHYGYRSSSQFTVAQYGNDQNFNATPSTSLELHTSVKISTASSQFYKNGISLGILTSGAPSNLLTVGLLNIGYYTPTNSYYNGSISELTVFSSALSLANLTLLDDNQLAYHNIATTYWTGAVSTDWTATGNWSTGIVPTISSPAIVVIPAGKPFYPVISGTSPANSISLEAGTSLTITGTLQLAGTIINLGTCTASSGTMQYIGLAPQSIAANTFVSNSIQNVIINNSTGVTLAGNVTVSGNLTFTTGKLAIGAFTLTIGGIVTNTVVGGLTGSSNSSIVVNGAVSPTLSFDQATVGTTNLIKNLTINSPGQIITLANNLVLNGNGTTTFSAGKLAIGTSTLTLRGTIINTVNDGIRGSASSLMVVDGAVSPTLSFDQTIPGTTNALSALTLNCNGQVVTLNRSLVIASSLNLAAGTLADGGNPITSTNTVIIGAGIFKLGSATVATTWPGFTTNTINIGGTVEYASGISQIVSAVPVYQNLIISALGGTTAANNLTVNGVLTLSAPNPTTTTGSLSMSNFTLTMGSVSTTIGQGDVTGIVKRTSILADVNYSMGNEFTSVTFPNTGTLPSQMSIKISIGSLPSWAPAGVKRFYDFIQTGGSGTKAVITAHYLDAELNGNIENKLVDFSYRFTGSILTEHGKSNFNTTQNWVALSNVNVAFFSSSLGSTELSFDESSLTTLTWNGSTSTSWITSTNWTPNGGPSTNTNLFIPDASTTPNDPFLPATASNGSVTIESGGILNSDPGAQLTINNAGLAWSNLGTFNASTSTITFTNANATLNGLTNFNNVTISSGAALLVTTGTTMRIGGTMTNNGTWSSGLLNNTVEYNGNNQTILNPNGSTLSYYHLIISGSGTNTLPIATLNILGDLTINGVISPGSTFAMNGTNPQSINGTSSITLNNLIVNSNASSVSLNQNVTISNAVTFTSGQLSIGNNTLTLLGSVINVVPNNISGGLSSNLVINGSVSPVLSFDQTSIGVSNALNNITINSSGQAPLLGSSLEVNGELRFTSGKLGLNGNKLTLKGTLINTVPGGLRGSNSSSLVISGVAINPVLSFDQTTPGATNLLTNFSINSIDQSAILNNPLIVNGNLSLLDGFISTTAGSLTLTATSTTTGGSDDSFVEGPVTRNTASTTAVVFPVGKTNSYRPVTVTPTSGTTGIYSAEYFPLVPPVGALSVNLIAVATNEYWDISRTSGPDAQVGLVYTTDNTWSVGSPTSMDEIFIVHLNSGTWENVDGGTIAGNTGSGMTIITSKVLTSFSPFSFGFRTNTVLPVTLISFSAVSVAKGVELTWITADEYMLEKYQVEIATGDRMFYTIGSVPATNSPFVKSYKWRDDTNIEGPYYYRLKMIDKDGEFNYSNIIKTDANSKKLISIYPNPVRNNLLKLYMEGQPIGNYTLSLSTIYGAPVLLKRLMYDGKETEISIDLNENIISGSYLLKITDSDMNSIIFKVIIQ